MHQCGSAKFTAVWPVGMPVAHSVAFDCQALSVLQAIVAPAADAAVLGAGFTKVMPLGEVIDLAAPGTHSTSGVGTS